MKTRALVDWIDEKSGIPGLRVDVGPRVDDIPDHLCVITPLPSQSTMDRVGQIEAFTVYTRAAAYDPDGGEDLAKAVDAVVLGLARQVIDGYLIVWVDWRSAPAPQTIDAGERVPWIATYEFETTK